MPEEPGKPPESWKCPTCRQYFPLSERVCPTCKVTQVRRKPEGEAPEPALFFVESAEIHLPHIIPEARFSIPLDTGATWASGPLVAAEGGLFLLSAKDNLSAETLLAALPQVPGRLGELSFAIPTKMVKRVVHDKLVGHFIEIEGKKIPLRLDIAGWKALDACCERLGIPHS